MDLRVALGFRTESKIDQAKNVSFAFAVCFIWVMLVIMLLNFLITPINLDVVMRPIQLGFEVPAKYEFFMSCIMAPLWEELAFRYFPIMIAIHFSKAVDADLVTPVVVASAIIFGWGHGQGSVSLLIQGCMGFVMSLLYLKNVNSYWSTVSLHAAWNIMCFFAF